MDPRRQRSPACRGTRGSHSRTDGQSARARFGPVGRRYLRWKEPSAASRVKRRLVNPPAPGYPVRVTSKEHMTPKPAIAQPTPAVRRLPVGAEPQPGGGAHFRVWAPDRSEVEVLLDGARMGTPLRPEPAGYFAGLVAGAAVGARYRYRLDRGDALPDPASRFQPDGPHGPSEIIDPTAFRWTDTGWRGLRLEGQVFYELHLGAFTPEGTWTAAARELPWLADLGVTSVEVMPVADFPGRFGW